MTDKASRISQARFVCGHEDSADVNGARNIHQARALAHEPPKRILRRIGKRKGPEELSPKLGSPGLSGQGLCHGECSMARNVHQARALAGGPPKRILRRIGKRKHPEGRHALVELGSPEGKYAFAVNVENRADVNGARNINQARVLASAPPGRQEEASRGATWEARSFRSGNMSG